MAYPIVERLLERFGERVRFVFRHFPLQTVHPDARQAHQAAEAAARQGRFWEMHALLFQNQAHLDKESIVGYAAQLGLDVEQFRRDWDGEETWQRVHQDFEAGFRSGVNRTPTFFIQGTRYDGQTTYVGLAAAIQAANDAQV
jgi:protein-disulfide isomerase